MHNPNNNNGWIEEDDKEEEEAEEEDEEEIEAEEDEEMEVEGNEEENDVEITHPYEEADSLNRPPPSLETVEQEFMNAPVELNERFQQIQKRDLRAENEMLRIRLRAVEEKAEYKHMEAGNYKNHFARVSGYYDDLRGWEYKVRNQLPLKRRYKERPYDPFTNTTSRPRRDDLYVMVRDNVVRVDAASDRGGEGVNTTAVVKDAGEVKGDKGAVGLCRWFERMESTFGISECAERRKVKFATATLHGRALTWWNSHVATLGLEVANGKPCAEVKKMTIDKFCPIEEVQRLIDELRHLKLRDTNIAAYTERFNELALLCPDVVPNEKKKVELYIKELPEVIKGETTSSRPTMLNEAVRMAHTLMEQKIQAKNKRIDESNKRRWENNNQGGNNNRNKNDNRNNNNHNNCGNYRDNNRHNQYNQRRQDGARAMTVSHNNVVDQGGPAPKCNRCGLCHFGDCLAKCTKCNKRGHMTKDCRARGMATRVNALPIRACYECEDRNHDRSRCPNLSDQRGGNATNRAYALREAEQGQGPNVVTGTFLLNNRYARVLFDSGSDKSFINSGLTHLIDIKPIRLNISYEVELADEKLVSKNAVLRGCTLNLLNQLFEVDLMPIELDTFDVIIGMDWLVKHNALIVCGKKEVHIPVKGKMLVVKGNYDVSRLKVVSYIKARKYIERGCHLFVAHVTEKEPKEKLLEDVPVMCDFPEVFPDDLPGLPPPRQVEFRIELVPRAAPVTRAPYRLAPSEIKEFSQNNISVESGCSKRIHTLDGESPHRPIYYTSVHPSQDIIDDDVLLAPIKRSKKHHIKINAKNRLYRVFDEEKDEDETENKNLWEVDDEVADEDVVDDENEVDDEDEWI
nr:hypothetical protein [Tanacetum cinerariifolium]